MFHCDKCWDNPCTCGNDFKHMSDDELAKQIKTLQAMLDKRLGVVNVPPVEKLPEGPLYFENGMTITELKALIKDWPEKDRDGDPTEVWMGSGPGLSSPVSEVWTLTRRTRDDGTDTADILFEVKSK